MSSRVHKVVLAYSGGLDTSIIVPWLKQNYGNPEVICYCANIGQDDELSGLEAKAIATGASKCYVEDLREEFVRDFLFPLLQSGAVYERTYLLGTSVARPLIARRQAEIALQEGADALAHGCTGKGNDQVRFELTYMAFAPHLKVIAPWREWNIRSREDALDYAAEHNVPVTATLKSIYSRDRNIWHMSHEGGILEDPWQEPEEAMYTLTTAPEAAPDEPEYVTVGFDQGVPVSVNGERLGPVDLLLALNNIGAKHGIGRVDLVENRLVGMKSHGVYETPGGTILRVAHQGLEQLALDRDTLHYKDVIAHRYAELVYYGQWYTPLREALDAFVRVTQRNVTGEARLKLYKGNAMLVGRRAAKSLYNPDIASFTMSDSYNQKDAEGFIKIFGLPVKVQALLEGR
ncbi:MULTISPECIES: argininosuccinate synthase [Roseiflexus]|jgi:argininosuccinate synthase|uniref:Argininosuccinate synthase n=1 Tax=Roseiflexus castenholzii (strain DSM 13941 / HLO8) TaxID=383372 RepID=ASSY_ROSCS|nr:MULTISPECIES: argininosuccinate synthase [Roseiflexus]A7NPB0.1 RecName: Full=Argininosuccinate synthase; AltName: Full=Citrulline--aspartate ligase [Roseiflexus castenholzii DSM 13941]ABU59406.1 Argininosuccinate synthase [Roseiflexus castenholzii DSM 13941]GIW02495.1 MAG: argininosuccinate synthase [Roseiflexus sp.]